MRRAFLLSALAVATLPAPGNAVPPNVRAVYADKPNGYSLWVAVRWERAFLGGGGGSPTYVWECDSAFYAPVGTVPLQTGVACYIEGHNAVTNGVPGQAVGPRAVGGGYFVGASISARLCVQGTTEYLRTDVIGLDRIIIPPTCFAT